MESYHIPVLLSEVLELLNPQPGESYLDLTAGYGGHAAKILDATQNHKGTVLVDRDEFAYQYLCRKFAKPVVKIVNSNFYEAAWQEIECGKKFDIILADFGISSVQVDRAERGFSFRQDGPLDMRMNQKQQLTAATIVNEWSERRIAEILVKYGEESAGRARKLAGIIAGGRPWQGTIELAEALAMGRKAKIHPATKAFQAIRIAVNDELGEIERILPLLPKLLKPGGRVGLITFHSLEDRLVKQFLKAEQARGMEAELISMTKKPVMAGDDELVINPRSRSAKLRVAIRK